MKSFAIAAAIAFVALAVADLTHKDVVGNWEGESICVNLKVAPACKNEHVIYHISSVANKSNQVQVNADKVVNKVPVPMGEITLTINGKASTLSSDMTYNGNRLLWDFEVKGDRMNGTLRNGDKVVIRRISLKAHKKV